MYRPSYAAVLRRSAALRSQVPSRASFSTSIRLLKDHPAGSGSGSKPSGGDHGVDEDGSSPDKPADTPISRIKSDTNPKSASSNAPHKPGAASGKKDDEMDATSNQPAKSEKPSKDAAGSGNSGSDGAGKMSKSDIRGIKDSERKDKAIETAFRAAAAAASLTKGGNRPPQQNEDVYFNPATGGGSSGPSSEGSDGSGSVAPVSKNDRLLPIQLQHRPVFPGLASHFMSTDPKLIAAIPKLNDIKEWDGRVVAVMSRKKISTMQLVTNTDDTYEVGCICRIRTTLITYNADDHPVLYGTLFPLFRVRVGELVETVRGGSSIAVTSTEENTASVPREPENPLDSINVQWMKSVSALPNEPYAYNEEEIQQLCRKIIDYLNQMSTLSSSVKQEVEKFSRLVPTAPGADFRQPDFLADFAASLITKNDELQDILEITNVKERVRTVAELLSKEVTYLRVQEGIYKYGHDQTQQRNREIILHEYLRYIKKELGLEGDDKTKLADKFQERADALDMPKEVRRVFSDEINKFRGLEPNAGEYATVRTYLDWLTSIPWGKFSPDKFVIRKARDVLDKSHYGLQDVKDRILEFLAVGKLSGSVDGKIICLAGPPGVGKTSIAKAIAEALGRKFDRFSVGGLFDVSEIKGHRRTYVASLPGRVIQALKKAKTLNPVILIDEVDKLARGGSHGDPAAALLEVLDPEQNENFQDTYLEVPVDLSRVLFVCTANNLENIPAPLMDRMEVIHIPGYLPAEKVEIAKSFLAPKASKESGLGSADINISSNAFHRLVNNYTRESGVRNLNKTIEKIYRKLAFQFVRDIEDRTIDEETTNAATPATKADMSDAELKSKVDEPVNEVKIEDAETALKPQISEDVVRSFKLDIGPDELSKYVGIAPHNSNRLFEHLTAGVSMGLAWTPTGGVPLFIESVLQESLSTKSTPKLTRTGQLGEVMNESTSIAYSFSRMFMTSRFPRNRFLDYAVVHTHFPEGAIKKDGPSAGIAMATSLISLAMNIPASNDVAMTGELTLTGKVLQIGGLREKAVAAKTLGATTIVFPEDNRAEWEDLPEAVREGLQARPVSNFSDVFDIVFGVVDPAQVNAAWPRLAETEKERPSKSLRVSASS